ncbi:hypothetical protein COMNV_01147 [Commensalibacter sp. Nvir]|uniref:MlaE family ABC transporter permease n=1 Tax=Commensalibacter sp. Nvir TaxID=3069817 RepID=UPI002D61464F|nr:hypothetical protein COMNV_01147 [Commensalibacter sp. Nvir]
MNREEWQNKVHQNHQRSEVQRSEGEEENHVDTDAYFAFIKRRDDKIFNNVSEQISNVSGRFSLFKKAFIFTFWFLQPILYKIGYFTRSYFRFFLNMLSVSFGVCLKSVSWVTWRRTVRYEFKKTLSQAVSGGFFSTLFTASLTGLAVVSQAVYWLGAAGLSKMTGPILITVILREAAPILVGMILLGRNGIVTVAECGQLAFGGQLKTFASMGIDPFISIVVPRTWALTLGCFSLGMIFGMVSLFIGYVATYVMGTMQDSIWTFYGQILLSMSLWDYILVPLKFLVIGFSIGIGSCVTGMNVRANDEASITISKGFTRGILLIMVVNILFTMEF